MSDTAKIVVLPASGNVVAPDGSSANPSDAAAPADKVDAAPTPEPRRGRWLPTLCALIALLAAAVALAAPGLRPRIAAICDRWFGASNIVTTLLAPSPDIEAGWRQAREEAMQAVNARFADYAARLDRLAAEHQATAADVARVLAEARTAQTDRQALSRAVDDLSRQAADLRETTSATDARGRAAGLLALSLRLRRDVDAGLPLDHDVAALTVSGPYPASIERAVQQLHGVSNGTPTMRDLAEDLDRILDQLAQRSDDGSWLATGWHRVAGLFGGAAPTGNARLLDHLRALAADGRFSEAATELEASDAADIGANWAARVHARGHAVLAAQAVLNYSLAAYENAFAASGIR